VKTDHGRMTKRGSHCGWSRLIENSGLVAGRGKHGACQNPPV